jgi:hypothetical protein
MACVCCLPLRWSRSDRPTDQPASARTRLLAMLLCLLPQAVNDRALAQDDTTAAPEPSQGAGVVVALLNEANWDELVPAGKEVDAIYGDAVLRNQYLTAIIAQPLETRHANMTVRNVAGCLIDLTVHDLPSDQLSAFYPGRKKFAFRTMELSGSAPASSETTKTSSAVRADHGSVTVTSAGSDSQPRCTVTYSLTSAARALTITSTWTNTTSAPLTVELEDDLRADAGKEDMPKAPNGTTDLFWFHDIFWQQAYGITADGFQIRCNSNARESTLIWEPKDGQSISLPPGGTYSLTRHMYVARDLVRLRDLVQNSSLTAAGQRVGTRTSAPRRLNITDGLGQPIRGARLTFHDGDSLYGTTIATGETPELIPLPAGDLSLELQVAGHRYLKQTLSLAAPDANAAESPVLSIAVPEYRPGSGRIQIQDPANGRLIPAKIQFTGSGSTPTPNWGPETAEHLVRNLAYAPGGQATVSLQSGEYDVTVSRGPEYDAVFTKLKIEPGKTTTLNVVLPRVVDTTGWVSADFHSHSSPSGDNTGSQLGRVLNLVAEHVEFAPCTEHNRVSTYADHIQSHHLGRFIATVSGIELTGSPLPLNHQNAFPMVHRPRTQDGGGPTTDQSPETQIERLTAWDDHSEKLVQQNHPDIGWLFFDRDGNQQPDEGYSRSFQLMNVMEVHPIDPLLNPTRYMMSNGKAVNNQVCVNWLQLLNQGYRIYGVVNTDAHYNYHGSGGLRIWLKSPTDEPAELDPLALRDTARQGQLIMSNGPFLEASFRASGSDGEAVIAGQDLSAPGRRISARLRVQCANWMDIDQVFVLVNGRRQDDLFFSREAHPARFGSGPVKFDQTIEFAVTGDSHLIVVAGHGTDVLGDVMGPDWGRQHPAAVSNPVFVDVDGNGFQPNRDTLDFPLPVRFVAEP